MSQIINGNFQDLSAAKLAVAALTHSGLLRNQISLFKVELPGHHLDRPADAAVELEPDSTETKVPEAGVGAISGAAVGGAIGAAIALATLPVLGPMVAAAAVSVGAYGGSLYGVLNSMEADESKATEDAIMSSQEARHRQSGILVALVANDEASQQNAQRILVENGAGDIELTQGTLLNGEWLDFNPRVPLKLLAS
jgi:phage tail tape-measure protein